MDQMEPALLSDLAHADHEELVSALQDVISYVEHTLARTPDPVPRDFCPEELAETGDFDRVWNEAQENGESFAAEQILQLIQSNIDV